MLHAGVYAIIDLYGQCAEVSITDGENGNSSANINHHSTSTILPAESDLSVISPTTPGNQISDSVLWQYFLPWFNIAGNLTFHAHRLFHLHELLDSYMCLW